MTMILFFGRGKESMYLVFICTIVNFTYLQAKNYKFWSTVFFRFAAFYFVAAKGKR